MTSVATVPGCIELVQLVAKKVLGKEVKLGDSLVEAGLDSMSSLSLHSALVSASGGLDIPAGALYELPTVLALATFVHQLASGASGGAAGDAEGEGVLDAALEGFLEDEDARRSYQLAQARDALRRGDVADAADLARRAAEGAEGAAVAAARAVEADALALMEDTVNAGRAFCASLEAREALSGPRHPDTAVALGRFCCWALAAASSAAASEGEAAASAALAEASRSRLRDAGAEFVAGVTWPVHSWELPAPASPAPAAPAFVNVEGLEEECRESAAALVEGEAEEPPRLIRRPLFHTLAELNLDSQRLADTPLGALGALRPLGVLRLRRAGLEELPEAFGDLVNLRELYLTGNSLSTLPASLASLARLHVLALEGNRFPRLPPVVEKLKRLIQLSFDEQRCEVAGLEACTLQVGVLSVLRARGCAAACLPNLALPPSATPNLNTIFWANNALLAMPPRLDVFVKSMRLLDLAHNRIESLGEALFLLVNLRDLSLAGNRLRAVPPALGRLRCLQQLWLHGNDLEELPEQLGQLESLAILELHHNRLRALPLAAFARLRKLNWLFAHGNHLSDGPGLLHVLAKLPRLKIAGLGANRLCFEGVELRGIRASLGLGWNAGGLAEHHAGLLSEALTTCDLVWDRMSEEEVQDVLVVTFSAQGAPVAQGQAELRALRDAMLRVDGLNVCDPANAWYLQDPQLGWSGLPYFHQKIEAITRQYRRVFMWGGSMGGSAALLFSCLADSVHAFSPQVDLQFTWPSFASATVRETFRARVQESVARCRGSITVHVGEENHNDNRHASALPGFVKIHLHDTGNHNTMKHVKQRQKLVPLLKFEVVALLADAAAEAAHDSAPEHRRGLLVALGSHSSRS